MYVNDLLTSGVIPDLFTKDEFDAIFQAIRIAAKSAGVPDVRDSLMQFFVDRWGAAHGLLVPEPVVASQPACCFNRSIRIRFLRQVVIPSILSLITFTLVVPSGVCWRDL